jgi:hypothetical protein
MSMGPRLGFNESRWNKCIHQLAGDLAMAEMEGSIVDRMWRIGPPSGGKLGEWETFKHYTEAVMDDGCHCPTSEVMDMHPTFETTMSCPPHLMEDHGECMFMPPVSALITTRDNAIKCNGSDNNTMDTNKNMFVNSAHRDRKSDCGTENTEKETDADTSIGSACRDRMSDCSTKTESGGNETDADASVVCTAKGSGRRGEASAETGDMGACTPVESTPGHGPGSWRELMAKTATIAPGQELNVRSDTGNPRVYFVIPVPIPVPVNTVPVR